MSASVLLRPQNVRLLLSVNLQKGMTFFRRILGGRSGPCDNFDHLCQARLGRTREVILCTRNLMRASFCWYVLLWICLRECWLRDDKPRHSVLVEMNGSTARGGHSGVNWPQAWKNKGPRKMSRDPGRCQGTPFAGKNYIEFRYLIIGINNHSSCAICDSM